MSEPQECPIKNIVLPVRHWKLTRLSCTTVKSTQPLFDWWRSQTGKVNMPLTVKTSSPVSMAAESPGEKEQRSEICIKYSSEYLNMSYKVDENACSWLSVQKRFAQGVGHCGVRVRWLWFRTGKPIACVFGCGLTQTRHWTEVQTAFGSSQTINTNNTPV